MIGAGRAAGVAVLAAAALVAACDGGRRAEDETESASRVGALDTTVVPTPDSLGPPPDSIAVATPAPEDSSVPLLPGEGEPRDYRLLLVNRLEGEAYVFASAGADRVALDTVPRSDSTYVDIRLRADLVHLEAEDATGGVVTSDSLDLVEAQVNRWVIAERRLDRIAARPIRQPGGARPATRRNSQDSRPAGEAPRIEDVRHGAARRPAKRR